MAWAEWEQLKQEAASRQATGMQLNSLADPGGYGQTPGKTGVLEKSDEDLTKIGSHAHTLYDALWDKARVSIDSSDTAASDLTKQHFLLGGGLRYVSERWEEQLSSLMDACAHISNHMQVTKNIHAGDEAYIQRQMSSIDTLDQHFDERVGAPGEKNPVYEKEK